MMLRAAETICKSDTGRQRRDNEDSAFARAPMFVVADGMGGAQAGEVASRLAIEAFEHELPESGDAMQRLADRVREANRRIYERSRADQGRAGMGTTLTAAYLDEHSRLAIAHVGDSRAYLFREGLLKRLTQDHSLVDELVRQGKLTEEQAAEHPQRSIITRALGPEPTVEVDTWSYSVSAGDVLLLCSDGLTSMISEERVVEILASSGRLDRAADALIAEANEAGGRDNITVVLFRLEEVGAGTADDQPTMVGVPAPHSDDSSSGDSAGSSRVTVPAAGASAAHTGSAVAVAPRVAVPPARDIPEGPAPPGRKRRHAKPLAALLAVLIVLFLIGGGGYLATRQLYFIGTNAQGIVTIYRGLPYDLPLGVHVYETFYVSGVPATLVPADRRSELFDNRLRSQSDARNLVVDLELGKLSQ